MALTARDIRAALQTSLIGEIYPAIRAVVYSYDPKRSDFVLRYYLDREPTEEDYESVSVVMTEFISQFKHSEFNTIKEECYYSQLPQSQIDSLDGFVYSRREYTY